MKAWTAHFRSVRKWAGLGARLRIMGDRGGSRFGRTNGNDFNCGLGLEFLLVAELLSPELQKITEGAVEGTFVSGLITDVYR